MEGEDKGMQNQHGRINDGLEEAGNGMEGWMEKQTQGWKNKGSGFK